MGVVTSSASGLGYVRAFGIFVVFRNLASECQEIGIGTGGEGGAGGGAGCGAGVSDSGEQVQWLRP